jgi:hypothetical protein
MARDLKKVEFFRNKSNISRKESEFKDWLNNIC